MGFDLSEWKPNKKQARFLALPFTIKEALYGGGAGSGKSDVLTVYGLIHKWHLNPAFKQVFLRRTHAELKNEIVPRTRSIYPKFGATFNASDMIWTFPREDQFGSGKQNSGAIIKLGHCENEKDVHQYDSMEITLFTPDEITSLTEYIYLYITFERNRAPKSSGLPSITRAAGMPGGVGHTFTYKRFVFLAPAGNTVIIGKGGNKRIYIHATQADNKDNVDPTYEQSLQGRPEAEKKAKLYGDWTSYQGQVFSEFRDKKYPDEPDNALHVCTPFEIPSWWPRIVIGDWGFAAMCYVGFYAISPQKRLYLYRELYWMKTKIAEWGPVVRSYVEREKPKLVKFCQSAGQDRGQNQTIQEQIATELGVNIELSVNSAGSRVAGKMLIHEYLRWESKSPAPFDANRVFDNEYAMWIFRNKGMPAYQEYCNSFSPPVTETNLPKLQIFQCDEDQHDAHINCCPVMVATIKACSYDKPKNDKPAEDVKEFDGDDPYDDLRYACDTAEEYYLTAEREFEKVQSQEKILAMLRENQDYTAFYRNMRAVEAKTSVQSVPRYHRRRM